MTGPTDTAGGQRVNGKDAAAAGGYARPIQLALVGAARAVGPQIPSLIHGTNAALIADVAPLYLTGSVLDVTYGRGAWWRTFTPEPFAGHDLEVDGVDFRSLPYPDRSWDTVCFDPPYIPRTGANTATTALDKRFRARYGLEESRSAAQLDALIRAGVAEAARVARRFVLAKCCDYSNGRAFHLGHARMIDAGTAAAAGLRVHDLVIHGAGSGPGGGQTHRQHRTRRTHSYLVVFSVRRRRA